ncbi:MAG: hypothetical protein NC078_06240 [Ruminococcus sp.]|nr:hypothetical protein [Ruminococcus sp.]
MRLFLQVIIYLFAFTAAVKLLVLHDPLRGIFFYPKEIQEYAFEKGLTSREEAKRRRRIFFIFFVLGLALLPIIFVGVWSGITDFKTAFVHTLVLLEVMNWFDGIIIDQVWVRFDKFWEIKGAENMRRTKTLAFMLTERLIMTAVYIPVGALLAFVSTKIAAVL